MLIPDNTDLALSILADYHEDNHDPQRADELREALHQPTTNDWTPQRNRSPFGQTFSRNVINPEYIKSGPGGFYQGVGDRGHNDVGARDYPRE